MLVLIYNYLPGLIGVLVWALRGSSLWWSDWSAEIIKNICNQIVKTCKEFNDTYSFDTLESHYRVMYAHVKMQYSQHLFGVLSGGGSVDVLLSEQQTLFGFSGMAQE